MDIGIIGLGHIGTAVARALSEGSAGDARLTVVLVRDPARIPAGLIDGGVTVTTDITSFLATRPHLVVEAAGHAALGAYAEAVLASGSDLLTVSVGAFADEALHERVVATAREHGAQVLVPSGAIAGLDAIGAAALGGLDSVTHTTRKPPRAFSTKQLGGRQLSEPLLLFDGPARDGVRLFPENVNVAAAVSLAGVGFDRTRLRVFADPGTERNLHEVELKGWFGRLRLEIENIPSDNPKTGRIVALSVAKAVRDLTAPIVLGR